MSERPAAFYATYVDAKFMRGLKVMRLSLDIPIEKANEFLQAFGAPDAVNGVPCAIARIVEGAYAPEGNGPDKAVAACHPHAEAESRDKPRTYTRSQIAALKCQDEAFQLWLAVKYSMTWGRHCIDGVRLSEAADRTLKEVLGIESKRALDFDGPKAAAFDKLLASFDYRDQVK